MLFFGQFRVIFWLILRFRENLRFFLRWPFFGSPICKFRFFPLFSPKKMANSAMLSTRELFFEPIPFYLFGVNSVLSVVKNCHFSTFCVFREIPQKSMFCKFCAAHTSISINSVLFRGSFEILHICDLKIVLFSSRFCKFCIIRHKMMINSGLSVMSWDNFSH